LYEHFKLDADLVDSALLRDSFASVFRGERKGTNGVYVPMSKSNPIDRRVYVCTDLACQLSISGDTYTHMPVYMYVHDT
jgi:hypothetical protein